MSSENSILFIAAHPWLERSRANRAIVEAVQHLPNLTFRPLYHIYPHFHVNVGYEQDLLLKHRLIVVQHPFYWYSMPPLLKMWLDEVFESGWAYGPGGDRLKGKDFLVSITAGGPQESYHEKGYNRFSTDVLLSPWNQTAHLCQMNWLEPRILHGSIRASDDQLKQHAAHVRADLEHYLAHGELPR